MEWHEKRACSYLRQHCQYRKKAEYKQFENSLFPPLQHEDSVLDKTFRATGRSSVTSDQTENLTDIMYKQMALNGCVSAVCTVLGDLCWCCVYGAMGAKR